MLIKLLNNYSAELTIGAIKDICTNNTIDFSDFVKKISELSEKGEVNNSHIDLLTDIIIYSIKWGEKKGGRDIEVDKIREEVNCLQLAEIFEKSVKIISLFAEASSPQ